MAKLKGFSRITRYRRACLKLRLMCVRFWENSPAIGNRGKGDVETIRKGVAVIARRFGCDPDRLIKRFWRRGMY